MHGYIRLVIVAVGLLLGTPAASADVARLLDGETLRGEVVSVEADVLTFKSAEQPAEPRRLAMIDVRELLLEFPPGASRRLIRHPGSITATARTGTIKLRAGRHRMGLGLFESESDDEHALAMSYRRGDDPPAPVRAAMFTHAPQEQEGEQEGEGPTGRIDAQGFRLPDDVPANAAAGLHYRYYAPSKGDTFDDLQRMTHQPPSRQGVMAVPTEQPEQPASAYGLVLTGYIEVPEDGAYTFELTTDEPAMLFFGRTPPALASDRPPARRWRADLARRGRLAAVLQGWQQKTIELVTETDLQRFTFHVPAGQIDLLAHEQADASAFPRSAASSDQDLVYVKLPGAEAGVRQIAGTVLGLEGTTLLFQYEGQDRRLELAKVAGIVPARTEGAEARSGAFFQRLFLPSGRALPGRLQAVSDHQLTFRTSWGELLHIHPPRRVRITCHNGRTVRLTQMEPVKAEHVPYFSRAMRYRVDRNFEGGRIRLIGQDQPAAHGISMHAKSQLEYVLGQRFERLQTTVGLLAPHGKLGHVDVRVLGDGQVLFEHRGLSAAEPAVEVDLVVREVDRLMLEVDFGGGQNVGDRVAWAEPILRRKAVDDVVE